MCLKIIRKKEVLLRTGVSNATLYRLIQKQLFPSPKKLTGSGGRAVGWLEDDIDRWIMTRLSTAGATK